MKVRDVKENANEFAQMLNKLDEPLKRTAKDTIQGMLMAQQAYEQQNQSKESAQEGEKK